MANCITDVVFVKPMHTRDASKPMYDLCTDEQIVLDMTCGGQCTCSGIPTCEYNLLLGRRMIIYNSDVLDGYVVRTSSFSRYTYKI